ncbi:hypothetical protein V1517DRAFT_315740 [Lipomyces orientalis]|uniref:Uncharacterized protein n=1 Tax=Lipomyces orientalis TaxID=1233043 RepID=A0ACC3TVG9_9ASCO
MRSSTQPFAPLPRRPPIVSGINARGSASTPRPRAFLGDVDDTHAMATASSAENGHDSGKQEDAAWPDTFFATDRYDDDDDLDNSEEKLLEGVANENPSTRKIMLKALAKANDAVVLDNDGNSEGAKMAYIEACSLIQIGIERSSKAGDRVKLRRIHDVYEQRISELQLGSLSASDGSIPPSPLSPSRAQSFRKSFAGETTARRSSLVYGQGLGSQSSKDSSGPAFRDVFPPQVLEDAGPSDGSTQTAQWHRTMNVRGSTSSISSASGAVSPLTSMARRGTVSTPSSPTPFTPTTADTSATNSSDQQFNDNDSFFEPPSPPISIVESNMESADQESQEGEDIVYPPLQRNHSEQSITISKYLAILQKHPENQLSADMPVSQVLQQFDLDVELAKARFGHPPVRPMAQKKTIARQTGAGDADEDSNEVETGLGLYYDEPLGRTHMGESSSAASIESTISGPASSIPSVGSVPADDAEGVDTTDPEDLTTPTPQSIPTFKTERSAPPTNTEVSQNGVALRRAASVNSHSSSSSLSGVKSVTNARKVTSSLRALVSSRTGSSPASSNESTIAAESHAPASSLASRSITRSQSVRTSGSSVSLPVSKDQSTPSSASTSSFPTNGTLLTPAGPISTEVRTDAVRRGESLPPQPANPVSRPFWLMRNIRAAITCPTGGPITDRLRLSPQVFLLPGVKLRLQDEKISACETIISALLQFEDSPSLQRFAHLERVMNRIEMQLQRVLVPDGSDFTHGFGGFGGNEFSMLGRKSSKSSQASSYSSPGSDASSERRRSSVASESSSSQKSRSWKKSNSRTVPAPPPMNVSSRSSPQTAPIGNVVDDHRSPGLNADGKVAAGTIPGEVLRGPLGSYLRVLVVLFERAQLIEQVPVLISADKLPTDTQARVDKAVRRASEFFGRVICKFVLADIADLMDKYVRKGSRWMLAA